MSDDKIELLMLDQFRIIRGDIAKLADDVRGLKVEMIAVRHHVRGMELQQDGHSDDIAAMKTRLDRIERRLELAGEKG